MARVAHSRDMSLNAAPLHPAGTAPVKAEYAPFIEARIRLLKPPFPNFPSRSGLYKATDLRPPFLPSFFHTNYFLLRFHGRLRTLVFP